MDVVPYPVARKMLSIGSVHGWAQEFGLSGLDFGDGSHEYMKSQVVPPLNKVGAEVFAFVDVADLADDITIQNVLQWMYFI